MKKFLILFIFISHSIVNFGQWKQDYYVDSFGDKTTKSYLQCLMVDGGTFSNSATNGSNLTIGIVLSYLGDKDPLPYINIRLFEYGGGNEITLTSGEIGVLSTKSNNIIETYYLEGLGNSLYVGESFMKKDFNKQRTIFLNHLRNDTTIIKCNITIRSKYSTDSNYIFSIPTDGFNEEFLKLK